MSWVLLVWKRLPRALVLYSFILLNLTLLVSICKGDENSSISLDVSTFKISENLPERSLVGSLAVVGIESNQSAEFKIVEESDQNISSIFSIDENGSIYTSSSLDYLSLIHI